MLFDGGELELIATTGFGLESVVARELHELGFTDAKPTETGRVRFRGAPAAIAECSIRLRCADRLLIEIGRFEAVDFGRLFDETRAIAWERFMPADANIPVRGRSVRSKLHGVPACQRLVKKAIVDRLMEEHRVSSLPETGPQFPIEVSLLDDHASLTLDTSGRALHRRGYRPVSGRAPLKETLAAALVQLSFWRADRPFLDPFCGTGTLLIEAAMIGRRIAPGLQRDFVAESWPWMARADWTIARERARDLQQTTMSFPLEGADVDSAALELTRYHARQAGVSKDIRVERRAFQDTPRRDDYGCLVTNPPYGRRLGGDLAHRTSEGTRRSESPESVRSLYASFPSVLSRLPHWSHFILVADRDFEKHLDRRADRRRKLYAGKIECTYYQFHGPRKDAESGSEKGVPPAPAFAPSDEATRRQAELLATRLAKRARHFRKWPTHRATNCYRLYDRDIKEIPLLIDRYGDAVHITEIVFPKNRSEAAQATWREAMRDTASRVLGVPRESVFFKQKRRHAEREGDGKIAEANETRIVIENGLELEVNMSDYVDTGLFMDQRETRARIRHEAKGTRFLNLFAYTGSFTVFAAAGGADSTTSVDRSARYLDWAARNLERNGFASGSTHRLLAMDCEEYLHSPVTERFDLAVVDPPTFSNRKGRDDWSVQDGHRSLLSHVVQRMSPGGIVYFSTNFKGFRPELEDLEVQSVVELTPQSIPEDFRNRRIHRCWRIEARS